MIDRRTFLATSVAAIGSLALPRAVFADSFSGDAACQGFSSLVESLCGVDANKGETDLEDVDFSSLSLCQPVHFYEAIDGGFSEIDPRYPILDQNCVLRMFAYDIGAESMIVTTALAEQISEIVDSDDEIAVIYDANGCYLARNGCNLIRLGVSSFAVTERDSIDVSSPFNGEDVTFSRIERIQSIDASNSSLTRSARSILGAGFVSQNPPSNICWAACVASIANYRNGGSRTAKSVAQAYLGSSYNRALATSSIPAVLSANGVSGYSYRGSWPADSTVNNNINAGYPIVGIMSVNGNTVNNHAVVVRGCTYMVDIQVMDPEFGFTTASKLGGAYVYSSGYSGASLKTIAAVSRW